MESNPTKRPGFSRGDPQGIHGVSRKKADLSFGDCFPGPFVHDLTLTFVASEKKAARGVGADNVKGVANRDRAAVLDEVIVEKMAGS